MHDRFEDILVEPTVGTDVVTLVGDFVTPGVFDLPAGRFVFHQIDTGEDHRVIHGRFPRIQHVCFGHLQIHAEGIAISQRLIIPETGLTIAVLGTVAAEPDDLLVFQLFQDEILEIIQRQVQIEHFIFCTCHIAQILDCIGLIVFLILCRAMDDADIVIQIDAQILLIHFLRSDIVIGMVLVFLVVVFESKGNRRNTEAVAQEAVALFQTLILQFLDLFPVRTLQFGSELSQSPVQQHIHRMRMR